MSYVRGKALQTSGAGRRGRCCGCTRPASYLPFTVSTPGENLDTSWLLLSWLWMLHTSCRELGPLMVRCSRSPSPKNMRPSRPSATFWIQSLMDVAEGRVECAERSWLEDTRELNHGNCMQNAGNLRVQVYKQHLPQGPKYINWTCFGLFGAQR